jgi:predicted nucleic acid-binding protein
VFLDTVGILAVLDEDDQWHGAASIAYQPLVASRCRLLTTHYVLLECGNSAARGPFRADIDDLRQRLIRRGCLIEVTTDDTEAAWAAYRRGEAANAGIVDQLSFVVMRRLGLTDAFTCDHHFVAAGFTTLF